MSLGILRPGGFCVLRRRWSFNDVIVALFEVFLVFSGRTFASGPVVRQFTNPYIIEHPEDQYVTRNEPATLNCKADGRPDPVITWYRNGQPVVTANENPSVDRMLLPSGQLLLMRVSPPGKAGRSSDVGVYYCNATNPETGLSVVSRNATLDIAVMRDEFREEPQSTEVAVGHEAVLRCRPPRAEPEPRVRWKKDDAFLPLTSPQPPQPAAAAAAPRGPVDRVYLDETGSLHFTDARREDGGSYSCVASNVAGERQSAPVTLTVREKPRITESPKDIVAKENVDVVFHCRGTGDPQPTIIWNKLDGQIAAERASITQDRLLQIRRVQLSDDGVYVCRVENSFGWREAEARLTVQSPPSFLVTPTDKTVGVGRQITFRCEVIGKPAPAVFWNKEPSETFMFPNQDHGRFAVLDDGSLVISQVESRDAGTYVCQGLSKAGTAVAKVKLQVKDVDTRLPPVIVHGPQNQTLPVGGTATLLCSTAGDPTPDIYWFRNGRVLTSVDREPRFALVDSGALLISDLRRTDTGSYICRASSETGTTSSPQALLTIDSPSSTAVVFHRSPQPATFPSPPVRPSVSDVTNTSVRLSWRPNVNTGASSLVGYSVEMFSHELAAQGWVPVNEATTELSYTVHNLRPATAYVFVVRARNSHGLSGPSTASHVISTRGDVILTPRPTQPEVIAAPTERPVGVAVTSLAADAAGPTALRLSWQLVAYGGSQQRPLAVDGFRVKYSKIDDESATVVDYHAKTVRLGDVTEFLLTELEPYTWYDIYVQPFYRSLEGAASAVVRARTQEDVPTAAPASVRAVMLDNSTLRISWKLPPASTHNGPLHGFRIYIYDNATRLSQKIEVNSSVESIVVYHLTQGLAFTIQLSAFNRKGEGPRSEPVAAAGDQPVTSAVKKNLVDEPWFLVTLVGAVIGVLSVISCIVLVLVCRCLSARKKSPKQSVITVPVYKFQPERQGSFQFLEMCDLRPAQPLPQSAPVMSSIHPTTKTFYTSQQDDTAKQASPRCYSNDMRASDGESRGSCQGNGTGLRSNGGGHYYYTLQGPTHEVQSATDDDNDVVFDDDDSTEGAGSAGSLSAVQRPIAQSYMIRQQPPPSAAETEDQLRRQLMAQSQHPDSGSSGGRRPMNNSLPTSRPVLFLPPPPSHGPYDDHNTVHTVGAPGSLFKPPPPSATNRVHQPLRPELKWTPITAAYDDGSSEIEDSGTGMWNGDADESSCDALATDYEDGGSSCGSIEQTDRLMGRPYPQDVIGSQPTYHPSPKYSGRTVTMQL